MPKLDGLRAIAAIMVLMAHYFEDLKVGFSFELGAKGVQIFFTISGFLITYILLNQKNTLSEAYRPKQILIFMLRRALRLFPIYYLLIGVLFLFSHFGGLWICEDGSEWYYFVYAQNYLFFKSGFQSPLLFHTWSLAVEEQFYLLWPFLIFYTPKRLELSLLISIFFVGLISKYYFYYCYIGSGTTKGVTFMHFDTLGIGSILAYFIHYQYKTVINFLEKFAARLFLIFLTLTLTFKFIDINGFAFDIFLDLMSVFLVFMASSQKKYFVDPILGLAIFNYLGKVSYGIYLYHKVIPFFFNFTIKKLHIPFTENKVVLFFTYTLIAFSVAIISWNTVEKLFLKIKNKIGQ